MPLFRLLLLIATVWLIYRFWKSLRPAQPKTARDRLEAEQMVRCRFCDVHVPKHTAIGDGSAWFCCDSHQREFLAQNRD